MELQKALYMLPVPISEDTVKEVLPDRNIEIAGHLRHFIVENIRTARRFLKKILPDIKIDNLIFYELNGHTPAEEISGYLNPLREGEAMGLMSEAGCPGVADPGAAIVSIAQKEGLKVIPLVGPSSILLSLMGSGLNGQRFAFHGYLPVDVKEKEKRIKGLEHESRVQDMTQIFIETPYRNEKMMESLLKVLDNETLLCIASDITGGVGEKILTKRVAEWKSAKLKVEKVPSIFLFYSPCYRK